LRDSAIRLSADAAAHLRMLLRFDETTEASARQDFDHPQRLVTGIEEGVGKAVRALRPPAVLHGTTVAIKHNSGA